MNREELFECLSDLSKTNNLRDGIDIRKEEANIIVNEIERLNNIIKEVSKELKEFNEEYLVSEGDHCVYRYLNELIEKLNKGE